MTQDFEFTDLEDGDASWIVVRAVGGGVALTISKRHDGDVAAFLPRDVAQQVAIAIGEAARHKHAGDAPEPA